MGSGTSPGQSGRTEKKGQRCIQRLDWSRQRRPSKSYHTRGGVSTRIILSVVAWLMSFLLDFSPERLALPTKVDQRDKNWRDSATKNTVYLKPHQLILLSIIAANCENKDGTPMTPDNRYKLVKKCLVGGAKGPEEIVTRFATAREGTAKDMKEWIAKSGYKDLFFQNTQAFLDIHKEKLEEMNLRVRIRKATEA